MPYAPYVTPNPLHMGGLLSERLSLRLLTAKDLPALMQLRADVLANLAHPDLYVRESTEMEFVQAHIDAARARGETIGVLDGSRLVAYGMLGLPRRGEPGNLGRFFTAGPPQGEKSPLGGPRTTSSGKALESHAFNDECIEARTAHLASCMVSPSYRGRHLQRLLLKARMALACGRGRNFFVAMVSPHNHASRHNLMREGFRVGWVGEIDGLKRQLMAVDLSSPLTRF